MRDKVNNEERSYTAYLQDGNEYQMVKKTVERLPSGFYYPYYDQYRDYCSLKAKKIIMPHLYILPNEIQNGILDDIKNFWGAEERYRRFGHVYKRNILLYSTPGNGKTSLIQQLCNTLINEHDGIVVYVEQSSDLFAYQEAMIRLRDVEPNRKVITVIEDFEKLAKNDECSAKLLQLLDGSSQFDNMVTIATTNTPEILDKQFTCRPSRFNIVIEYKKPNATIRRAYIIQKLEDGGIDTKTPEMKENIDRYVKKTRGYTFDFLKDAIQAIYVDGITEEVAFHRLNELKKKNGKIKVEEEHEAVVMGFQADEPIDIEQEAHPLPERPRSVKIGFQHD